RLILTTLSVGLFSITALGAAVVFERGRWRPVMLAAYAVSASGLLLYLYAIWLHERTSYYLPGELFAKAMFIMAVWAIALPHMGLLGLAPRSAPLLRWVRRGAILAVVTLAAVFTRAILLNFERDEDLWLRAIGVLGILSGLGTLTVPILARVQRIDQTANTESTPLRLSLTCPRCLTTQEVDSGHARCATCRLKFHIEIEEPRCPACNYLLHMLTEPVCPECGRQLGPEEVAAQAPGPAPSAPPTAPG
ncbi:MAG: zinc ribbon domain-containing protein, partial [Phycisphaeraceae bacterium]